MMNFGKIFTFTILLLLVGVNFASTIPAGNPTKPFERKTLKLISESEEVVSEGEPELEEESSNPIYYGPGDPQPTGNSVEVDALGPYGTPSSPYYEGDTVDFQADIINGSVLDYYFSWDVDGDGYWETPLKELPQGDSNYSHTYTDDYEGQVKVQAWDGKSYNYNVSGNGTMFNEALPTSYVSLESYEYLSVGVRFTAQYDITIIQMGIFNGSYYHIKDVGLFTERGSLLGMTWPIVPLKNTWEWGLHSPVTLLAGNTYIVYANVQGNQIPCIENPGTTQDNAIEILDFRYYNSFGFPYYTYGKSPLPLVDIRYEYGYKYDTIGDYTDVHVENVPPTPDAGTDIITMVGDRVDFLGSFLDPGLDDTHDILWNFGDGFYASGRLNPFHIYHNPGEYTVTLRIMDDDGGVGFDSLTVIVKDTRTIEEKIKDLMKMVESLNLPEGLENALLSKLENALDAYQKGNFNAALNKIMAFILHVGAQSEKKIPKMYAEELIETAQVLKNLILKELG